MRSPRRERVQLDLVGFVDDLSAGCVARRVEILGDRGLAIGHHALAGEFLGVDEEPRPAFPGDGRTVMGMAFAVHARAEPDLAQQRDGAGLEHPGADAPEHVGTALPFQDDAVDAVAMEDVRQEQPGRTAADDRHLGSCRRRHVRLSRSASLAASKRPGGRIGKRISL